jgi:SHS2 domain-containing protein
MKFKFVKDLTSDVVFEAYGKSLKEVFENAALALFNVICKIERVKTTQQKVIEVSGNDASDLMFNWLQELIGIVDTDGIFLSKFVVNELDEKHLRATVYGERADPRKGGTVVKAVTYYKFRLERGGKGYKVTAALDI